MENFNRKNLPVLRDEIAKALKSVEEKHGITFKLGGISFTDDHFRSKIEAYLTKKGGETVDPGKINFDRHARSFGLSKEDFGKKFSNLNGTYQICGIASRSHKYPILAKNSKDGRIYKFRADDVISNLKTYTPKLAGNVTTTLNIEIKEKFISLVGRLSPENLTCDGEIYGRAVQVRLSQIKLEWRNLEKQIGRKVSETEAEKWMIDKVMN